MNRFIIADASKCIGCRTCEVAWWSLIRKIRTAPLTPKAFTAYSRDQRCQRVDGHRLPSVRGRPCANVCPNGAIGRDRGFVHVMGALHRLQKTCVVACPNGARKWWCARLSATAQG